MSLSSRPRPPSSSTLCHPGSPQHVPLHSTPAGQRPPHGVCSSKARAPGRVALLRPQPHGQRAAGQTGLPPKHVRLQVHNTKGLWATKTPYQSHERAPRTSRAGLSKLLVQKARGAPRPSLGPHRLSAATCQGSAVRCRREGWARPRTAPDTGVSHGPRRLLWGPPAISNLQRPWPSSPAGPVETGGTRGLQQADPTGHRGRRARHPAPGPHSAPRGCFECGQSRKG